jgi:penicillin-binding protein 2
MKLALTCTAVVALVLSSASSASALDVPHNVHHLKPGQHVTQPHITDPHHAAHAAAHAPAHATAHTAAAHAAAPSHTTGHHVVSAATAHTPVHVSMRTASLAVHHHYSGERFTASSFVTSQGEGDVTAGEDPTIRAALIDALGNMNGTALVIDPSSGRILSMVNQKLALSPGAEPCSTIKLSVGLAALSEGLVTRETPVNLGGFHMNMTQAIAHSNNLYFEELGRELGFERVRHYATQFGLGELAGYNIPGEQLGAYPDQEIPANEGGVARMCSFGQGVSMTPLQLGAFVASLANGGTLYYLQHPTSPEEAAAFEPKIKRTLDIARFVPELQEGMSGAVEFGTARRLRASFRELPVFGKTGTCSNNGTRFGWFVSYSDSPSGNSAAGLVTVFFLEGGRPVFGPRAAELTGLFYRSLWDRNYFANKPTVMAEIPPPPPPPPVLSAAN